MIFNSLLSSIINKLKGNDNNMDKKITYVISAFPGCGKSHCFNNNISELTILDSDSSNFSWIKDDNGVNTKDRNPEFPNNYIQHIKSNIGKVDVIFVSSHEVVRKALFDANINVILVYPSREMKYEWIDRFRNRGNDESFIKFISDNWDSFITDMEVEDYGFELHALRKNNRYLDLNFIENCREESVYN